MQEQTNFDFDGLKKILSIITVSTFAIGGYYFETGWPHFIMVAIGGVIGYLFFHALFFLFKLLGTLINKSPIVLNTLLAGTLTSLYLAKYIGFRWPDQLFFPVVIFLILFSILSFFSFRKLFTEKYKQPLAWLGIMLPILFAMGGLYWLFQNGNDPYSKKLPPPFENDNTVSLSASGLKNPAEKGNYKINTFTYGSGKDKKRKEYAEGVKYKTPTVDAHLLLPEWKEKKKKWRERFWGFGVKEFPLNGRVYMPEGDGPFPLVLIVHGNHSMVDFSDDGYGYLGELIASRGFIAISVDENFINAHWSGDFRGKEMPARAWLLLKHLEQWEKWNNADGHELANKIDMENIILIGHSRGGKAVSIAAAFNELKHYPDDANEKFDFNFNIKGIVTLAPTDYRYHRKINLENINYLSLQGSYDADEVSFWGMRKFHRLKFTDEGNYFKAGVYIHRANHGQFNSTWGNKDFGGTFGWLLNTAPLLSEKEQEEIAKIFVAAFVEAICKNNSDYLPLFKNVASGKDWLPKNYYLTHFRDNSTKIFLDFEKDIDLTKEGENISIKTNNLKIWREENLRTRDGESQENNMAVLGWDYGEKIKTDSLASYEITFTDSTGINIDSSSHFLISIATGNFKELDKGKKTEKTKKEDRKREEPKLDFTIHIYDQNGQTASTKISDTKRIAPMLKSQFTKLKPLDKGIGEEWEMQPASFFIPIAVFQKNNPAFNFREIKKIEFVFDQINYGVVGIDDIGFSSE